MASGDLLQQRSGSFGAAYESTPGTGEASPVYFLVAESANIDLKPAHYKRINNIGAEVIGLQQSGYDASFSASNIEPNVEELGYLFWLALGAESNVTGVHTIPPVFDQPHLTAFVDRGGNYATNAVVERLIRARIKSLSLEQARAGYAKVSLEGTGCTIDDLSAGFTPSLDLTADGAPLSWASLNNFQVAWNGGAYAAADYVKALSIKVEREINPAAFKISTNQPGQIAQGERNITFSFTFDLLDSDAQADGAWQAVKNGQNVGIQALWVTGTHNFSIEIPNAHITNSPPGEIGAGADPQEWTVEAQAYQAGSTATITAIATDGNVTNYDAR